MEQMAIDIKEFLNVEKEGLFLLNLVFYLRVTLHIPELTPGALSANQRPVLVSRD